MLAVLTYNLLLPQDYDRLYATTISNLAKKYHLTVDTRLYQYRFVRRLMRGELSAPKSIPQGEEKLNEFLPTGNIALQFYGIVMPYRKRVVLPDTEADTTYSKGS